MELKENIGLILIIIGIILTIFTWLFGIPFLIIGTYYLNKKKSTPPEEQELNQIIKHKQETITQINQEIMQKNNQLTELNEEINTNQTLQEKRLEINNINQKLNTMEKQKTEEINTILQEKRHEIDNINQKLTLLEKEKTEEINKKLEEKQRKLQQTTTNLEKKKAEIQTLEERYNITKTLSEKQKQLINVNKELKDKKEEIDLMNDEITAQEYGLYKAKYNFTKSEKYKEELKNIRQKQKDMIKNKTAAICDAEWTVEGSKRKGQAMTNQNIKQALYAFNIECQQIISKTRPTNTTKQKERIQKVYEKINKMNERNMVHLTPAYLNLKYSELDLAVEYELKKQEEKELLKEAREREKEELKLQRELDKREKEIEKQKTKLQKELEEKQKQAEEKAKNEAEKQELLNQIQILKKQIAEQNEDQKDVENKRLRTGAGFVYIISNIGSFGKDIYKIGVTRRDDPTARVHELSNASVPFKYDVHAFIFSNDAFELETKLHQKYDKQRVNKVNNRKEFFKLTPQDIEQIVKNNKDNTYDFTLQAEALEYYETLKIEEQQTKLKI